MSYFKFIITIAILSPVKDIAQNTPIVKFGGALRFNYIYSSWKDEQKKQGGDFMYDMFRINAKAEYKRIKLDAEYRLYSDQFGGGVLKQGWIGYDFNEKDRIQVGLIQVPFGIQQYNSHNWFFNIGYYIGLEDDHDIGIKFIHEKEQGINYQLAFFKNSEAIAFGGNSDLSPNRYSYDVSSMDADADGILNFRNKEVNQLNYKINYKINQGALYHQIGAYAQFGGLYNLDTKQMGSHYGYGILYELDYVNLNIKSELLHYKKSPKNPENETSEIFAMSAYGSSYLVASKANVATLAIAYTVPVQWGPVESLQFYNDFGYVNKHNRHFSDSYMNVTGVGVSAGHLYTYFDLAAGKNHSWLGGNFINDFAQGNPNAKWEARFNINIGYYF